MPKKGQSWSPEQRAKILAAKQVRQEAQRKAMGGYDPSSPEAEVEVPVQRRPQYEPAPQRPSGSRWQMKAGRWDEDGPNIDVNADTGDMLHIPAELHPEGITLQWVTHSVYGKEEAQHRQKFEQANWLPVHGEDFYGAFDGMFAPRGTKGEIHKDGLVLMAKPTELVQKAKRKEQVKAKEQVMIKERALYGGEINAMGADHPSARNFNHVRRSVESVPIPRDD